MKDDFDKRCSDISAIIDGKQDGTHFMFFAIKEQLGTGENTVNANFKCSEKAMFAMMKILMQKMPESMRIALLEGIKSDLDGRNFANEVIDNIQP